MSRSLVIESRLAAEDVVAQPTDHSHADSENWSVSDVSKRMIGSVCVANHDKSQVNIHTERPVR